MKLYVLQVNGGQRTLYHFSLSYIQHFTNVSNSFQIVNKIIDPNSIIFLR